MKLEEINVNDQIIGLVPNDVATIKSVTRLENAITIVYKTSSGSLDEQTLYREQESSLSLAPKNQSAWSFESPGDKFKLALEAKRMDLASCFDPMTAINSSNIDPLPHQIAAVYESMLPKLPLRYILADDPGAGKTVMAGLLIQELINRADVERALIVAPGSLVDQWQDEMWEKFGLKFEIFDSNRFENSSSGNYFEDENLLIARLDQLARDPDNIYIPKLKQTQWDLVVVDEAHKMSAHVFGNQPKYTQRFRLGEVLRDISRHFLLMTATPHNGKEEDFQLWLSLLDPDQFNYQKTAGAATLRPDIKDVMRRLIKEDLVKFDGTRLFPMRVAQTVAFELTPAELELYEDVTKYVVDEMNRADALLDKKRTRQVGFALTMLQRRLASSPKAIYESLRRRREKLEKRLKEVQQLTKGKDIAQQLRQDVNNFDSHLHLTADENNENLWEDPFDDLTAEEEEEALECIDLATAAQSIPEFLTEIGILKELEKKAEQVYKSGKDQKWSKLSTILQDSPEFRENGRLKKLIIFTEHTDTLDYLTGKISNLFGNAPEAVLTISGKTKREMRREIQEKFRNNEDARVLIATDAAGEGVNLQCANMMINYDLPWNPNRIEQRFGRIHRIGQTQQCFLWNLVAYQTREGEVFQTLFDKIQEEMKNLKGRVFDVLGQVFEGAGNTLQELIIKAIRNSDSEENKKWMTEKINKQLDFEKLKQLMDQNCLVDQVMNLSDIYKVRDEMERAVARKLQPCFVRDFFIHSLKFAGGSVNKKANSIYKVGNVPSCIRNNKFKCASRKRIVNKYDNVCFEREKIKSEKDKKQVEFIHLGHPLMRSLIQYALDNTSSTLKPGSVLIDPNDLFTIPSIICLIESSVLERESKRPVSKKLMFVRITPDGNVQNAGMAPHLDFDVPKEENAEIVNQLVTEIKRQPWCSGNVEDVINNYVVNTLGKEHYEDVKIKRNAWLSKVDSNVRKRLRAAIANKTNELEKNENQPDTQTKNANIAKTTNEINALKDRLKRRTEEIEKQKDLIITPPNILGAMLVIPQGLINQKTGVGEFSTDSQARNVIEKKAMEAVMEFERAKGNEVIDVSAQKCGWDITSRPPKREGDETIPEDLHIEVKGRAKGATTVTITRNEVCYAFNQKDKFWLAIVFVDGDKIDGPHYIHNPFQSEPDDAIENSNYSIDKLLQKEVKR